MNILPKIAMVSVLAVVQHGFVDAAAEQPPASPTPDNRPHANDAPPPPPPSTTQTRTTRVENSSNDQRIVVHRDVVATDQRDRRSDVGGIRISSPTGWVVVTRDQPVPVEAESLVGNTPGMVRAIHGLVPVPDNTIGPGIAMWRINERWDADQRLADARVDLARTIAERARTCNERSLGAICYAGYDGNVGFGGYGGYGGGGLGGGWGGGWGDGGWHDGLRGPLTSTVTRFDDLGSTAQRAYSNAAYPRLNGTQDAHDRAVSQFGRDATPPVVRIQNDIDRAHNNAATEQRPKP